MKKANKVTFIYAVKDSMFKDENQRAKFFEFILPIIPVMNPVTTFDNIDKMHKQLATLDSSLKLSEQFLKDISFYVSDMRVLKNTFNDYVIMANKLSENSDNKLPLKKENLFALALYKNLYPYDYSRLQKNEGLIPLCIEKDKLIDYYKTDIDGCTNNQEIQINYEGINCCVGGIVGKQESGSTKSCFYNGTIRLLNYNQPSSELANDRNIQICAGIIIGYKKSGVAINNTYENAPGIPGDIVKDVIGLRVVTWTTGSLWWAQTHTHNQALYFKNNTCGRED